MENEELFKAWPKISRIGENLTVTITEKIDGTNACIIISDGEIVGVQSRNRLITPESDNAGFARWVRENEEELKGLGDGYHYGEWAGPSIQQNPLKLEEKAFFLFNTFRWGPHNPPPTICKVVPVLNADVEYSPGLISDVMRDLKVLRDYEPEGIIVYFHVFRTNVKVTYKNSQGKWNKENN